MKNTYLFYIVFQVLKVLLIKICKVQPPCLLFLFVFILTSAGTHKFLELHSKISEKKMFSSRIFFLTDLLRPPHPLKCQNPLNVTKVFC